jgi:drug/metabolite transporter (DMT)-like permease
MMAEGDSIDTIDLTTRSEEGGVGLGFRLQPYSPERKKESVRAWVTGSLLGAFIVLIVFAAAVAALGTKEHWDETKEMLQVLLPAVTGLLGSALGFYFWAQSKKDP